ncbi:MAG: response regulator, partial [Legionellales bacterium]
MQVLLIEDDEVLGSALSSGLELHGWKVNWVKDGAAGLKEMVSKQFNAVILDLMLPKIGGMEVLEYVRSRSINVPVMILTTRDNPEDKIKGFNKG